MATTQLKMLTIISERVDDITLSKDDIGVAAKAADLKEFEEGVKHKDFPKYAKYVLNLQQIPAKKVKSGAKKIETLNGIEVSAMVKFCDLFESNQFSKMDKPRGAIASKIITAMWKKIAVVMKDQQIQLFSNIPVLKPLNDDVNYLIFLRFKNAVLDSDTAKQFVRACASISSEDWANIGKSVRRFMDQRLLRAMSFVTVKMKFAGPMLSTMQDWAEYMVDEYSDDKIMMEQIRKVKPRSNLKFSTEEAKKKKKKSSNDNNLKEEEM